MVTCRSTRAATHRRSVWLDRVQRSIEIEDEIKGGRHDLRLAFHCGPEVEAELDGALAVLRWPQRAAGPRPRRRLELPPQLRWSLHHGETDPILGWYAVGLGRRVPAFTLVGRGRSSPGELLQDQAHVLRCDGVRRYRTVRTRHIMGPIRGTGGAYARDSSGGHMSEQTLDLRRSLHIAWRTRPSSASWPRSGFLLGAGYASIHPAMLSAKTLVVLPQSTPNMAH